GQLLEQEGNKAPDATGCYRLAMRHDPRLELSYARLAYLLRRTTETNPALRKRNHKEADRVIDELVLRNPASHSSYLARWRYRRDFDLLAVREAGEPGQIKLEAAAEDVASAMKRKPQAVEVLLAAADLERLRGRGAAETDGTPEERWQRVQ